MTRFKVVTTHGESATVFTVVDSQKPAADQPAVVASFSTRDHGDGARAMAEYAAGRWVPVYYGNWFKIAKNVGQQVESAEKWRTLDEARAAADKANGVTK